MVSHAASIFYHYNCLPIKWWKNFIKSTQELCVPELVFSKWKHMNFKEHIHKNMDCGSYTNKLTSPSPVTSLEKGWLIKTDVRPSNVLDAKSTFQLHVGNRNWHTSLFNPSITWPKWQHCCKGILQQCVIHFQLQTHLTTSAFISDTQRWNTGLLRSICCPRSCLQTNYYTHNSITHNFAFAGT